MVRFKEMRISQKVRAMIFRSNFSIALLLGFLAIGGILYQGNSNIEQFRTEATELVKIRLSQLTETATSILSYYENQVENKKMTPKKAKEKAFDEISKIRYDEGRGYFWINDKTLPYPKMVMHPIAPQLNGVVLDNEKYNCAMGKNQNLFQAMVELCLEKNNGYVDYIWPDPKNKELTLPKLSYVNTFEPWNIIIGTGVYIDDIDKMVAVKENQVNEFTTYNLIFYAVLVSIIILIILRTAAKFSNELKVRLNDITQQLKDISSGEGDLTKRLNTDKDDEIGDLSKWFNKFVEKLQTMIKTISKNTSQLNSASIELSQTATQLATASEEMSTQVSSVASSTEQASASISNITSYAEQLSNNSSSVATAIQQMTATIDDISRHCIQESQLAENSSTQALNAQEVMKSLDESATEIGKIVDVINEINHRTNLLSINAAIEAAAAGAAGKGFAVVASEVKALAKKTEDATGNITNKIEHIQTNSQSAVEAIKKVNQMVTELNHSSKNIAVSVKEQSDTTKDISQNVNYTKDAANDIAANVQETSYGLNHISKNSQHVSQAASDTAEGAVYIKESAENLEKLSLDLKNIVEQFKV